ncbi:restriction endonuclease [Ruegeria sp. Ofav3-42]|nr:restriction endonuclease [Ruegeria sp. Ofav3-42]
MFDVVRSLGFQNIVWRTPGADGGRDIEAYLNTSDPTGFKSVQKWHVECKRYEKAINWTTVWEKISHADGLGADVLFLVTNSTPSPQCEDRISDWNNQRRRPAIRVWRGYNFPSILRSNRDIAVAHGILDSDGEANGLGAAFASELAKLVQSAHGAIEFGSTSKTAIEAASALAELLEHRLRDLNQHGKFQKGPLLPRNSIPAWLKISGSYADPEDVSFRALTALMRHFRQCKIVHAEFNGQDWLFSFEEMRVGATNDLQKNLKNSSHWLRCDDIVEEPDGRVRVRIRD